jgi:L-alanine-DL-glutamate epimerase-like enolase superfamily enzyme
MNFTRRELLSSGTLLAGAALIPVPEKLAAQAFASGSVASQTLLGKALGQIKIAEVNAYVVPKAVFVQVVAEDGTSGWGEAGHEGVGHIVYLIKKTLDNSFIGSDVFAAETVWMRNYFEHDELGPTGLLGMAISGIDNALWDLRGKLLGLPVYALLGGKFRDEINLYGSITRDNGKGGFFSHKEMAAKAAMHADFGMKAVKLRMAFREERSDPVDDPTFDLIREVRRAIGDKIPLYIDPNNGYSAGRAVQVGKRLQDEFDIAVFEGPVAKYHWPSLAQVADELSIPVAEGEYAVTRWQFRDLILQGRPDILNPDLSICGGITEGKKIAALAEAFDKPIAVHNARPTLLCAAHVHYLASCVGADRPQEHPGPERLKELWRFFKNDLLAVNGKLKVPERPGIGLDIDAARVIAEAKAL